MGVTEGYATANVDSVDPKRFQEHQGVGQSLPTLYSSQFLPEFGPTLEAGVTAMSAAVLDLLGTPGH